MNIILNFEQICDNEKRTPLDGASSVHNNNKDVSSVTVTMVIYQIYM